MKEKEVFISLGIFILFGIGTFIFHSILLAVLSILSAIYCASVMINDLL